MRMKIVLLAGLLAGVAMGQVGGPSVETLTKELHELEKSGVGQEQKRIHAELNTLQQEQNRERDEAHKKLTKLRESPEWKEVDRKRNDLYEKRNGAWEEERKRIAAAAKVLYLQRHEELKPLAAGPLVEAKKLGMDVTNYPRIDGSTSTHPLSIVVAARLLGTQYEWTYPEPQGSPWGIGEVVREDLYMLDSDRRWVITRNREAEFTVASARMAAKPAAPEQDRLARIINTYLSTSASTHGGYVRLVDGECDLNLTVRGPSEDELKAAKEKGVEIELVPVAKDALVFMVSAKNDIPSLTREQIREGFSTGRFGTRTLHAYWRERNSGSRELFDAAIGATVPEIVRTDGPATRMVMPDDKGLYELRSMSGPYSKLLGDTGGIAYSVWYYDRYMAMSPRTRTIAVDGVEPTRENITSGKYPLVTTIYAAHRKGEKPDSPTMKLIGYLLSDEGQKLVQESGYVPLGR